jgi:hypothetical protein
MRRKRRPRVKNLKPVDVEAWLAQHPDALIECPHQPGHLKLTPQACAKRYLTANEPRWANIGAEPFPVFVFKMNLIPCRKCKVGARMAQQHDVKAA